jgi:hypothetical protein
MYMIFATFNGCALIHMFFTAPETKGKTLEEMDVVFDSGLPAWKSVPKGSRLDQLQKEIEEGKLKVHAPRAGEPATTTTTEPNAATEKTD